MKTGKSIVELATEVQRQAESKKDFIADTKALTMDDKAQLIVGANSMPLREVAHQQLGTKLNIPKPYYDKMLVNSPKLLAENVNHWLHANPERRMIRTLDGNVRAYLSDRYRALDNFDLLQAVLPVIGQRKAQIMSSEVTEKHLYLKVIFPDMQELVPASKLKNDVLFPGVSIRNSEVGFSSFCVEPFFWRQVCTNGMIGQVALRKYHVGKANGTAFEDIQEVLRTETRELSDKAFWMQVQDVVRHSFNRENFMAMLEAMNAAAEKPIEGNPVKVVEVVQKAFSLSESQGQNILMHLIQGGDLSQWGLANAVTRTAEDQTDYESATDLERLGGKIIQLPQTQWAGIAKAA